MDQQALVPEKIVVSKLDEFRTAYPLRPPRAHVIRNQDEIRQLTQEEGLEEFDRLLGAKAEKSTLPRATPRGNTYLWVIDQNSIPAALETVEVGQQLASGVIKHTNLTGGQSAHCGGEVWFINEDDLLIGGSSGRYGPDTGDVQQLLEAALVFKEQGYRVAALGMDETGFMATLLVGDPQWL
jgi:hypothetical protein